MGVKMTGDWTLFRRFLATTTQRSDRFRKRATELALQDVKQFLESELPKVQGGQVYGQVSTTPEREGRVYNVEVEVKPETLDKLDPKTSVIYVNGGGLGDSIVAQRNPYDLDSLPVYRGLESAKLTYRAVRPAEVVAIHALRQHDQQLTVSEFARHGMKVGFGGRSLKYQVTRDVAFQMGRMAYGIAGEQFNPILKRMAQDKGVISETVVRDKKAWKELVG